jgi:ankyrin repeat protein
MTALPKYEAREQLAFFTDRYSERKPVLLVIAAYYERYEQAVAILRDDPEQIRAREPFAGLTALHIAIFRGHLPLVKLLAEHPRADLKARDNFGRRPVDMCIYSADAAVFEIIGKIIYGLP